MRDYKQKILLPAKFFSNTTNPNNHDFIFAKVGVGSFSFYPNFISLFNVGSTLIMVTEKENGQQIITNKLNSDDFSGDYIEFGYNISQIIRKYPITSMRNGYFEFNQQVVVSDVKYRTFYVKLVNGDLYEVVASKVPYNITDPSQYDKVGYHKRLVANKISSSCCVVDESVIGKNETSSVFFDDTGNEISVKTGEAYAPIVTTFIVNDRYVALSFYPSPVFTTFLAFKKSDYESVIPPNSDGSESGSGSASGEAGGSGITDNIPVYVVSITDKRIIEVDVADLDGGVKKAFSFRNKDGEDKLLILTDKGSIYINNERIGYGSDIGVYWTEVMSLHAGCLSYTPVGIQKQYLENNCKYSNKQKALKECEPKGWAGVGAKNIKFDPQYRTTTLSAVCDCKWYQDVKNQFTEVKKIGIPIWQETEDKWHSLNDDYNCYFCDGSNAEIGCNFDIGLSDEELREAVETMDFYYESKQKNNLLISKSIKGEFYEHPSIGYLPLRITYQTKDEIKLRY